MTDDIMREVDEELLAEAAPKMCQEMIATLVPLAAVQVLIDKGLIAEVDLNRATMALVDQSIEATVHKAMTEAAAGDPEFGKFAAKLVERVRQLAAQQLEVASND